MEKGRQTQRGFHFATVNGEGEREKGGGEEEGEAEEE